MRRCPPLDPPNWLHSERGSLVSEPTGGASARGWCGPEGSPTASIHPVGKPAGFPSAMIPFSVSACSFVGGVFFPLFFGGVPYSPNSNNSKLFSYCNADCLKKMLFSFPHLLCFFFRVKMKALLLRAICTRMCANTEIRVPQRGTNGRG